MSFIGAKVTTYGKKRTQVIAVHADLDSSPSPARPSPSTPRRPALLAKPSDPNVRPSSPVVTHDLDKKAAARPPAASSAAQTKTGPTPTSRPVPARRQPSKLSRVVVELNSDASDSASDNSPPKPLRTAQRPGRPTTAAAAAAATKAKSRPSTSSTDSPVFYRRAPRLGRAVIPRSPSTSPLKTPVRAVDIADAAAPATSYVPAAQRQCRAVEVVIPVRTRKTTKTTTTTKTSLTAGISALALEPPTQPLFVLLEHTVDTAVHPLSSITTFLAPLTGPVPSIRKLGEASYSEVFLLSGPTAEVVVKVIPLLSAASVEAGARADVPDCSEVDDVVREIRITKRMTEVEGGGFVRFLGAYVAEGAYPSVLLDEWDEYKSTLGSASSRPHTFLPSQQYALIALSNSGTDLESFEFDALVGWEQAAGVFWSVASALARAEAWAKFEHRDLHEGQVLVRPVPARASGDVIARAGVETTLIDFGLSRLDVDIDGDGNRTVAWAPLPDDVYDGVGAQWDVYRAMRARVDDWAAYNPITNVLWLHYLAHRLLHYTPTLTRPRRGRPPTTTAGLARAKVRERQEAAHDALAAVDAHLAAALEPADRPRRARAEVGCAGDVVAWGRQKGWLA
ncbi:hypothetical protein Q5752_004501 [Cryptotrichosporon argae]